jgi:hypothetical protein
MKFLSVKYLKIIIFLLLLFLGVFLIVNYYSTHFLSKPVSTKNNENLDVSYEMMFVEDDLHTYGYSSRFIKIVKDAITSASKEFDIPIGLLHAIFRIESDYHFNITHPTVTVMVKGKPVVTNAIGLGGIIWEFWGDSLISKGIAENKMDLYLPDVNIRASAYVLRVLINQELSKSGRKNFMLSSVITRYYGEYSQMYMLKMEKVTSDLWMKRITKEIVKKETNLFNKNTIY